MNMKKTKNFIAILLCMFLLVQMGPAVELCFAEEVPVQQEEPTMLAEQQKPQTEPSEESAEMPEQAETENQSEMEPQQSLEPEVQQQTLSIEQEPQGELQQQVVLVEEAVGNGTEGGEDPEEQEPEADEDAEYLERLEVFNDRYGTGGARTLTRHEELDKTFGGRVYMVDYGSTWTSEDFWVAAKLSEAAPENPTITMSARNLGGEEKTVKIVPSTDKRINRTTISDKTIFSNNENGARRAVYTITVGTEEKSQVYKIIVNRVLELSSLRCYIGDELNNILEEKFEKDTRLYMAAVSAEIEAVTVKADFVVNSGFGMAINEEEYEPATEKRIPVIKTTNDINIRLSKQETYPDPDYQHLTYKSVGEYNITVRKSISVDVVFAPITPEAATICVYDRKGDRIYPEKDKNNTFRLLTEESYTYNASCYGYQSVQGEFQAEEGLEIPIELQVAETKHDELTNNEWWNYRNNEENNGVTSVSTPENAEEVVEKWAVQLGGDWSSSFTPPLILGGAIYTASEKFVYKIEKDTGKVLATSENLKGSIGFALNPLTYAEGMIFAQVGNGQIQALDATTLQSVWISEPLGGQTLSPITYKNGYIYSGTWNSELAPGTYFCLSVTDEDPNKKDEIKYCTWKYSHKGGFYWAGAYVSDKYAVFGSDDGSQEGNYTDNSILYSVSSKDGVIIDKKEGLKGDIRTSVVYDNGYVYIATKGGYLYRVRMNDDGSFGEMVSCSLGGMATASPVVYKDRIYIGVCGTGGQFNTDGGHNFTVLNQAEQGLSVAYTVPIKGYPQAGALLSNAYEGEDYDGDGEADGRVYVYFTYNSFPGGIMGFVDSPEQTSAKLETYFEPEPEKQQFCISPLCIGSDGIIYYKNDSCYLMAVESNSAYLKDIQATASSGDVSWDAEFKPSRHDYVLKVDKDTESVTLNLDIPPGRTVTVEGEACSGTYTMVLEDGKAQAEIRVKHETKSRVYRVKVEEISQDAALAGIIVSSNNNINNLEGRIDLDREFDPLQQEYVSDVYGGSNAFLNIYALTADENAKMEIKAVSGIEKINRYKNSPGSNVYTRFAVYFGENEAKAVADITVTAADGETKLTYRVTLRRTDVYAPKITDIIVTRTGENSGFVTFNANEAGKYYYHTSETADLSQPAMTLSEGLNRLELTEIDSGGKNFYITAMDSESNVTEASHKITIKPYKIFQQTIKTNCTDAGISIKDTEGKFVECRNGSWQMIDGNTYYITIQGQDYETLETTLVADSIKPETSYQLISNLSSNTYLKELLVSSSEQFGSGILELAPQFDRETVNYSASYGNERSHLTLWALPEDSKAKVNLYAVSGVKGETVNKDETVTGEKQADGRYKWNIYFGKGQTSVKVRVQVTAQSGKTRSYFTELSVEDKTAPNLYRVSASRISADKASVVFKTDEKGRYYYKVVEKDAKPPEIGRSKGEDVLAGTVTISLSNLKRGAKDIYIVMMDHMGNESKVLKMEIPDIRASMLAGSSDKGNLAAQATLITGGLTGKVSGGLKKLTFKDGDKSNLKKNDNAVTETEAESVENTDISSDVAPVLKDIQEKLDIKSGIALIVAILGMAYLIFWLYSCNWYRRRKQKFNM